MERERHQTGEPRSTTEARRAISETRSRIARDLDAIEDRIVEKRDELKTRADIVTPVRRRIRERVWPSLGIALGLGFTLGRIGGGDERLEPIDAKKREARRGWRAQRRAHLRERARSRSERRAGPSTTGMLVAAVVSGIATRFRRFGRELLAGRR